MFGHEACNNKKAMCEDYPRIQDNYRIEKGLGEHRIRPFRTILGVTNPTSERGPKPNNSQHQLIIIIERGITDRFQTSIRPTRAGIGLFFGGFGDDDHGGILDIIVSVSHGGFASRVNLCVVRLWNSWYTPNDRSGRQRSRSNRMWGKKRRGNWNSTIRRPHVRRRNNKPQQRQIEIPYTMLMTKSKSYNLCRGGSKRRQCTHGLLIFVRSFFCFYLVTVSGVCVVLMLQIMYCSKWTIDRKRETQRAVVVAVFDNNHEVLRSTLLFFFFLMSLFYLFLVKILKCLAATKKFCRYNRVLLNFTTIILDNIGNTSTTIERRCFII